MTSRLLADIYNYRKIDDRLSTSGQPSIAHLAAIAEAGFQVIVNLALHDDPRYSLPDEPGVVRSLGLKYVHIPVQFSAPNNADLCAFFETLDANQEAMLWLHCAANLRVSAFLGLYRVIRQGWRSDDAFDVMLSLWKPDPVWSSFINRALDEAPACPPPSNKPLVRPD